MQIHRTRPPGSDNVALLTAADAFCAQLAEPDERENRAELFIRLLVETLESDRLIRAAIQMNVANRNAEKFSKRIRADFQDALRLIGPLDCVQHMSRRPKSDTN